MYHPKVHSFKEMTCFSWGRGLLGDKLSKKRNEKQAYQSFLRNDALHRLQKLPLYFGNFKGLYNPLMLQKKLFISLFFFLKKSVKKSLTVIYSEPVGGHGQLHSSVILWQFAFHCCTELKDNEREYIKLLLSKETP